MSERINFGQIKEVLAPPNLIENQIQSFKEFMQNSIDPMKRKNVGLQAVFKEVFPIETIDAKRKLDFVSYRFADPKHDELHCIREGSSFSSSLYVKFCLVEADERKEEEIYMGEVPIMSSRGSFIINGAERVVVSQLHRSPGICFEQAEHSSGKVLYSYRIIPDRGVWIEVQFDQSDLLYVYLDRKRRRRKFLLTTLLRALGFGNNEDILKLFYNIEDLKISQLEKIDVVSDYVLVNDVFTVGENSTVIARAFEPLTNTMINDCKKAGIKTLTVVNKKIDDGIIVRSLKKDSCENENEALKYIYKQLRPGDVVEVPVARAYLKRLLQDPRRYDLGRVGRYKINQKLSLSTDIEQRVVQTEDLVSATKYLCQLKAGKGIIDDIDHLGSRRVRNVGELLAKECRSGISRTERTIREKMTSQDQTMETLTPSKLINSKSLSTMVRDFFARSQLSQFMDQINPLSELTHKRRLSALGPGGLSRDRAGFEVRDVHHSHYGRICPIETPEGPNIGLINSLSTYARVNEFGFIETPYKKVVNGKVTDQIDYLTADQEENCIVAQANSVVDEKGNLVGRPVVRDKEEVFSAEPSKIDYMDISPRQMVSVAAGLIPFLEHDDANRALMGSNMQRQGVPLLIPESPFVGTGIEKNVAVDSRTVISSDSDGIVALADCKKIIVTKDGLLPKNEAEDELKTDEKKGQYVYILRKFLRSNAATSFNQRPVVRKGQEVKIGQLLADGASTQEGELGLGKNVLVAFMPWNGYNFEDAILLSEKLIKRDVFTSVHIEEYACQARDTKLGVEEITRDIPNIGEEALKNLDRNGVIRIGAEIKPGDILVGKVTPKSETELAPEEKLLRAIFGEKASDVKDTSVVVPSGQYGIVMDVKVSTHTDKEREKVSPSDLKRQSRKINEEYRSQFEKVREDLTSALSNVLLGEKIPFDVFSNETGEVIIPANRKITKTLLRKLAAVSKNIEMKSSPVRVRIIDIVNNYQKRFEEIENEKDAKIKILGDIDNEEGGTIKSVKVYIATKRKIQVGDKMAGRHGNKGVVARIVAEEDMPYLPDGTPIEICLNPLGVPSRMNVGQVLETHLGWACKKLGIKVATPVFDGIAEKKIRQYLVQAGLPESGKTKLIDGLTGEYFDQEVLVGYIYMMKLNHLVADKIHGRAVGPYSLITQQPLGGKAQYGGQRFGEMEVWALEAYGAAYTLQEILTVKSDDVVGRTKIYEQLVKGDNSLTAAMPQSFNVLMKEMKSLCLDIKLKNEAEAEIDN